MTPQFFLGALGKLVTLLSLIHPEERRTLVRKIRENMPEPVVELLRELLDVPQPTPEPRKIKVEIIE